MIGMRVMEIFGDECFFENLSLETGVDITDKPTIEKKISNSSAGWMFHFAAMTNVDGVESDKELGKTSPSWRVNVTATADIAEICRKNGKKMLYLSTDYVFDGTKDSYTEEDAPNPLSWYGKTKYEGELKVLENPDALVVRIANPYLARPVGKIDFVHAIHQRLSGKRSISAPSDQIFVPTCVDDIASAMKRLISTDASGVYHVVGDTALSPFDAAVHIAKTYELDDGLIQKTTFEEYFEGRAPRPFRAALDNAKIRKLGEHPKSFVDGLEYIKNQSN